MVFFSRTCKFCARTVDMLVMPNTKQMESRILDFPLPFRPVMELKLSSLVSVRIQIPFVLSKTAAGWRFTILK